MPRKQKQSSKTLLRTITDVRCTRAHIMTRLQVQYEGRMRPIEAYSHNVSYRGMGFYISHAVPVGISIQIRICYSPDDDLSLGENVTGLVRWCKRIGQWYGAGVEFKDLDPEKQPLLFSYIESSLRFHHQHSPVPNKVKRGL